MLKIDFLKVIIFSRYLLKISILVLSKHPIIPTIPQTFNFTEYNCQMRDKERMNCIMFLNKVLYLVFFVSFLLYVHNYIKKNWR